MIKLVKVLLDNDESKKCPFCSKSDYGEEKHDYVCPFAVAYSIKKATE
jgi:hypothetical protein